MKKYISMILTLTMILGMSMGVSATRMRQNEKQQENTEQASQQNKDWGSINYVENLPGPDFSGYTYGGVPVEVPNYNNYSEFTAGDITNFSDAIVDMKGWDALIGSIKYDLGENILNFTPIPTATDSNKNVTGYSRKKFGWEDIRFKMKINDETNRYNSWAGITILADATQRVQWTGVQGYLIVMKKDQVELQKYFPSQEMLGIYEHDTIKVNTWQDYDLQMSPEGDALRIKFIVDGVTIFDYLDEDTSKVLKEGYVNLYAGEFNLDLQPVEATISHTDSGVNSADQASAELIVLKPGKSNAYVDGELKAIDAENENVVPINNNGRVMIPLRFLAEALGAAVTWNDEARIAKISNQGKAVSVVPGFAEYVVDGKTYPMDTAAELQDGRILVPVRMISEALGKKVSWEDEAVWVSDYKYELTDEIKAQSLELLK